MVNKTEQNCKIVIWKKKATKLHFSFYISVVDFFNRINLIYGTVSEYCDSASCPTMSGGARFEYLWADGDKYKKPTALPAPQYVSLLMDWTEAQINNESIFPVSTGKTNKWSCNYFLYCVKKQIFYNVNN